MVNYKRKVTYFYQYHNDAVGATAGFLKMEIRGDKVKITLNIQENNHDVSVCPKLCFYHEAGDDLNMVEVCDVKRESGVLTLQTKTDWQSMFDTGRDLYSFDGVIIYYNDNDFYLGDFDGRDRKNYDLRFLDRKKKNVDDNELIENIENGKVKADGIINEKIKIGETIDSNKAEMNFVEANNNRINNNENDITEKNTYSDFAAMLAKYPKLPMYGVSDLFDCVRIHPKDIGKLDIGNWKLGMNSFLTHGYYTYQYLMLGNMRFDDGKKHPVLGVPGMYSGREKYLANMFGFYQFVPVKQTGANNGQFGYWIVELNERNV